MQVPKRKSEEQNRINIDFNISQHRFNQLQKKLENLTKSLPSAAAEAARLAAMGDFTENAPYQIAKGKLRSINAKILETQNLLKKAVIIKPNKNSGKVEIGNTVAISVGGQEKAYQLLGSQEANPSQGIISVNSPIGSALLGKKKGDKVVVEIGAKKVNYVILNIE